MCEHPQTEDVTIAVVHLIVEGDQPNYSYHYSVLTSYLVGPVRRVVAERTAHSYKVGTTSGLDSKCRFVVIGHESLAY